MSRGIALPFHDFGAEMGVGGQHHAPAALPPGNNRYPLYSRLGGPQGRSGRVRKISPPTGIRSPDRPGRSESLYRLSYPGPYANQGEWQMVKWAAGFLTRLRDSKLMICARFCSGDNGQRSFRQAVEWTGLINSKLLHLVSAYFIAIQ